MNARIGATFGLVLIFLAALTFAQGVWMRLNDAPKSGAFGEAVVGTGDKIYLARTSKATSSPEFFIYTAATRRWRELGTGGLPAGAFRSGTALAWDDADTIYALVGGRQKNDTNRKDFFAYSISQNRWESLQDTPDPQGAGDALGWDSDDRVLYALIGSSSRGSGFAKYNPSSDTWDTLPLNPSWDCTDDGASMAVVGRKIFAIKGECSETQPNGDFAVFLIDAQQWQDLADVPDPEGIGDGGSLVWPRGLSSSFDPDFLYALGGNTVLEKPENLFMRYDIALDQWERLPDSPCPVGFYVGARLAVVDDAIHLWQGSPKSAKWVCGGDALLRFETQ